MIPALPNRPHGVDHEASRQPKTCSYLGSTSWAASMLSTVLQQLWPCRPVNGSIHSTAAEERVVGGIHDGIDVQGGDIPFDHNNSASAWHELQGRFIWFITPFIRLSLMKYQLAAGTGKDATIGRKIL
jgi:hypothetical protein